MSEAGTSAGTGMASCDAHRRTISGASYIVEAVEAEGFEPRVDEAEALYVITTDQRHAVKNVTQLYKGTKDAIMGVAIGEVFREAVRMNAAAVAVAHNHPSGDATPSPEDMALTRRMVEAGELLSVRFLDHVVIARGGWVSIREYAPGTWEPTRRARLQLVDTPGTYEGRQHAIIRDRCNRSPYGVHVWTRQDEIDDICRYCQQYAYRIGNSAREPEGEYTPGNGGEAEQAALRAAREALAAHITACGRCETGLLACDAGDAARTLVAKFKARVYRARHARPEGAREAAT